MSSKTMPLPSTTSECYARKPRTTISVVRDKGVVRGLRAGIVGAGLMGRWHANAIRKAGGHLLAVSDIDIGAARRLATGYHAAESFSDISQMLNQIKLHVLHICTPSFTHYKLAELAIEAGLQVIIEKPIAPTAVETERLVNQAVDRGVLICPVHQFLFQDGVRQARELLPRIGRVVHMEGTFCSAGGVGLDRQQLDEIVADILPHPLSLMQVFLPKGLSKEDWVAVRPGGHGELRAVGEMSGITLSIFISMHARPTECSFRIGGTNGTIHMDLFHGYMFIEPGKVSTTRKIIHPFDLAIRKLSAATINLGRRAIRWQPAYPGLQRLVSSFYNAVQSGSGTPVPREGTIAIAHARDFLIESTGLAKDKSR